MSEGVSSFDGMNQMSAPEGFGSHQSDRPVATWIGVISIVLGILGLLCWGGQAAMVLAGMGVAELPEGMPEQSPAHEAFSAAGYIAGVVLAVWLLAAGIGVTTCASWARRCLRGWAWTRILVAILGLIGAFVWIDELVAANAFALDQEIAKAAEEGADVGNTPLLTEDALESITMLFIVVQTSAVLIWPVMTLFISRRRGGM